MEHFTLRSTSNLKEKAPIANHPKDRDSKNRTRKGGGNGGPQGQYTESYGAKI